MLINEKIEAAMRLQHEKNEAEREERLKIMGIEEDISSNINVEKGDMAAMIISAFIVIFPVIIGALLLLALAGLFFFFH